MTEQKTKKVLASEIMNKNVVSVSPNTPVLEAAKIISDRNLDGIPVVDESGQLIGILTEYDLITKTSPINIDFIKQILSDIKSKNDGKTENLSELTVKEVMNPEPLTLKGDATYEEVIQTFKDHHRVNPIPVIDDQNHLIGLVTEYDLINKTSAVHLPTLQIVLRNLPEFRKEEAHFQEEILNLKVTDIMNKDPLTLTEDIPYDEVIKLFREHHRVNPIPVIGKDGKVIGVISRFDVLRPFHVLQGVFKYF